MTTATPPERLLSIRQAAHELGVSYSWIYAQVKSGRLPVVELGHGARRGKVMRIAENDLVDLVATALNHHHDRDQP